MLFFKKNKQLLGEEMLFSNKALFALIVPLLFQQVLEVLVGTIDSVMVSSTGTFPSGVSM